MRLLYALWQYSPPEELPYWKALSERRDRASSTTRRQRPRADQLDNIEVRIFRVPPMQGAPFIPYTRVNHAKLVSRRAAGAVGRANVDAARQLITESLFYVGTSNWAGGERAFAPPVVGPPTLPLRGADYFVSTGGVGWTIASTSVVADAQAIFDRDWASNYSTPCC